MTDALIAAAAELERSRHQVVERYQQPGNGYRPEVRCRCGWDGWATSFAEHRARAALEAAEAKAVAMGETEASA